MGFNPVFMLILIIIILGFILYFLFSSNQSGKKNYGIKDNEEVRKLAKVVAPTFVLTHNEKPLFFLIQETYPEYILLTQVSFSAIVKTSEISQRNAYNRLRLDYLIVSNDFAPIVVIELDDRSHKAPAVKAKDDYRDNLLSAAGIPTIRFQEIPSKDELKRELNIVLKEFEYRDKTPSLKKAS